MSWPGERQGVARAAVAGDTDSALETDAATADTDDSEENQGVSREEYLAAVAWVEGESAVDELSRRMVDDLLGPEHDSEGSQYGDSTLPGGAADSVPDAVQMTRGGAAIPRSGGTYNFSASDNAQNPGYTVESDWINLNGGEGFMQWHAEGNLPGASREVALDGGFQFQAGAQQGEMAMIRDLDTTVGLDSGIFSVTMWGAMGGADEQGDFAGFAVYGRDENNEYNELFRWGFTIMEEQDIPESFAYSLNGGDSYVSINPGSGYPSGGVDYSLTWALVGGTIQFTLSATDPSSGGDFFTPFVVYEGTPDDRVVAIAAVLSESGQFAGDGDGSEMQFDNLRVEGHEPTPTPAVPEPGTLGLLAAGLAALWRRKAKREK